MKEIREAFEKDFPDRPKHLDLKNGFYVGTYRIEKIDATTWNRIYAGYEKGYRVRQPEIERIISKYESVVLKYNDAVDKRIELMAEIEELKKQIENMKCCGTCCYKGFGQDHGICQKCNRNMHTPKALRKNYPDAWEPKQ